MLNYCIDDLRKILNSKLIGTSDGFIESVLIDSRQANISANSLYFAIVGDNHDGHQFIDELYQKGVKVFVVSSCIDYSSQCPNASFLIVNNTLLALQRLSSYHRSLFTYPVIGITGSNGKTIVKEWLSQLLGTDYRIIRSPKSYNSQVGVPLSVLQMASDFDLGVFEAGISKCGEMSRLEPIIAPTIGIFTNIGSAHQENFDNLYSKVNEKMKLFANTDVLIYCSDYSDIDSLAKQLANSSNQKLFRWSRTQVADVQLVDKEINSSSFRMKILYQQKVFKIELPFTDEASFENSMHCVCVMLYLGISINSIANRLQRLQPVAMRLELKKGINGCTILNDSYNSDIGSLSIALDYLAQLRQHSFRVLILSDILQSGQPPEILYSKVAELVQSKGVNKIIGIGDELCRFANLFPKTSVFYPKPKDLLNSFTRSDYSNAAILIKGSRPFKFELISALLEQKSHRTILEINLNALVNNLNYFRSLLKPDVKVMAMVKAFSYGSGSYEIANFLQFHRVDYLGVAFADEGIALREAGITLPIVVLNPAFGSYELMIEYGLEPELFSFGSLDSFSLALVKMGVTSYPVHIKIDTGMHRLGFMERDVESLCQRLIDLQGIKVQSIFSHLVATDDMELDDFTQHQITTFERICAIISDRIGYEPIMHILNSAGIERFTNAQYGMVRLGIGLYGVSPVHQHKLQTVSSLMTFIAQIRELPAGETVGYNRKGELKRASVIATLPIGYADGLNRRLSNGIGKVLIKGKLVPTVGNISMDTCMVDVTGIDGVKEGDEVIIFGTTPSVVDIAKSLDTIPYEVLTSISQRVNRVYTQE